MTLSSIQKNTNSSVYNEINELIYLKENIFTNVTDLSCMFSGCSSLISLPDISKWDTKKVTKMSDMFSGCSSLISLPDISKWETKNITNMIGIFGGCSSLISLPDISKWNTKNVTNMFKGCHNLLNSHH